MLLLAVAEDNHKLKRDLDQDAAAHPSSWNTFSPFQAVNMRFTLNLATLLISLSTSQAFIGLGISMYNPSCAFSYRAVIASVPLECSEHGGTGGHMGHGSSSTTPECRAGNTPFLTTLAWCINSTCADFDVDT